MAGFFDDLVPAQPTAAPAPIGPAPMPAAPVVARPYGQGSAYSGKTASAAQLAYAAAAGAPRGEQGSATNPTYDTPDITGADTAAHVDLGGNLHTPQTAEQAVTIPAGAFDDLVPSRMNGGYWQGLSDEVGHAAGKVWSDLGEGARDQPLPTNIGDAARQAWQSFTWLPRTVADTAGLIGSPIEGGVIQPAARLMDKIPLDAWSGPQLQFDAGGIHIRPSQRLTALEKHDANAGMLRNALSAVAPADAPAAIGAAAAADTAAPATGFSFTPEQESALQFITKRMPATATPSVLEAAPPQITAAEAISPRMGGHLDVLAKQPGVTGDALAETVERRRGARPAEILGAAQKALGVDPAQAMSALDRIVAQGRSEAKPLYDWAWHPDNPNSTNMWNPEFESLAKTDAVQRAMKRARSIMSNEGVSPEILGAGFVENPEQWATYEPPPITETEPRIVGFAGRASGPAQAPSQGPSLLKFIADNGGIADESGDVTALGGDQWHVGKPYQRRLIGTQQPDDVALRAWEAGYFPPGSERPSVNDLYDAIGGELRGRARYSRDADPAAQQRFNRANAEEERAYYGGDPGDLPDPDAYGVRPAPTSEPARQMVPTTQFWDYIKRGLDDELAPYSSGKLDPDEQSRSIEGVRGRLVAAMRQANPDWATAADTAGDYLAVRDAARFGTNSFFLRTTTPKMVAEQLAEQPYAVRNGMKLGVAEQLRRTVGSQNGVNQALSVLGAGDNQEKLRILLGSRNAGKLLDAVGLQKSMRDFESGLKNSKTAERLAIQSEQAGTDSTGAAVARGMKDAIRFGPNRTLWSAIHTLLDKGIDRVASAGLGEPERNEAGAMLAGSPQEMAQVLRRYLEANPGALQTGMSPTQRMGMFGAAAPMVLQPAADRSQ